MRQEAGRNLNFFATHGMYTLIVNYGHIKIIMGVAKTYQMV